jgi:hypothetical protein
MSIERWVRVEAGGVLILHEENDGVVFLRRGPEATERVISPEELKTRYPSLWVKTFPQQGRTADRAAIVGQAILQIVRTAPAEAQHQAVTEYLRDEFADLERQIMADRGGADA